MSSFTVLGGEVVIRASCLNNHIFLVNLIKNNKHLIRTKEARFLLYKHEKPSDSDEIV